MNNKLTTQQLADWIDGQLDATTAAQVEAALATALPDVHARAQWLRNFAAWRSTVQLPAPPTNVRTALRARFAARHKQRTDQPVGGWQRLVGRLQFDSWTRTAVGARAADLDLRSRHLLFSSEPLDVTLHIVRSVDTISLAGQLLPNDGSVPLPFAVQLLGDGEQEELALTHSDDLGEFSLNVPSFETATLLISGAEFEIVVLMPPAEPAPS